MFERLVVDAHRVEHDQLVDLANRFGAMLPQRQHRGRDAVVRVIRAIGRRPAPARGRRVPGPSSRPTPVG